MGKRLWTWKIEMEELKRNEMEIFEYNLAKLTSLAAN